MSGGSMGKSVFYYLGLMLVCVPFLRANSLWLPVVFLLAWGVRRGAGALAANEKVAAFRERGDRLIARRRGGLVALPVAAALLLPLCSSTYLVEVVTSAFLYAILASALNITVGLTGVLVLGFIGFYAIGAYTTGILTAKFALCGFWVALPLSGLAAMLFGVLLGMPTLRLKGDYLAIVTLGFGEIVRIFLNNLDRLTGGPNGILGIRRPGFGPFTIDGAVAFYYFTFAFLAATVFIVARLVDSRFGRAWVAVRENEMAAGALGIDVFRKHLLSFSLSAFFAGIAGSLFAAKQGFISPDSFTFYESVLVLCMVVLGGLGNVAGAVLGACLLIVVPEFLREFALYRMLVFGAVMIAFMIFRPHGILGSRTIALEREDAHNAAE
ncbi:MAG TPA: branched-chain amino acid ABC transporter permease [Geobacteraceae bacterium]